MLNPEGKPMLTLDAIIVYMERSIAEDVLAGNKIGLKHTQTAAGVIMAAAEAAKDGATAARFRSVAAQAANKLEDVERAEERA